MIVRQISLDVIRFRLISFICSFAEAQKTPYYASYGPARLSIHSLCTSHYLDLVITFIICINVITMSLEHYSQPLSLETALKYCNYFFTSTFVIEASLKLVAFGFRRFFKDRWNQLDLAIVLLSVMGITLEEIEINASLPINPTIIRIMRVLRIARASNRLRHEAESLCRHVPPVQSLCVDRCAPPKFSNYASKRRRQQEK
ncbi:hypothetical protein NL108_017833 [Boleophthalmus pectinirostris]|nr:hypothetical protein NL108_017833 [Boleophthalmus pectinirostris]